MSNKEAAKQDELLVEQVALQEQEKQFAKQRAKWQAEEEAKIQLMKEVYESRAATVTHKKIANETNKWIS